MRSTLHTSHDVCHGLSPRKEGERARGQVRKAVPVPLPTQEGPLIKVCATLPLNKVKFQVHTRRESMQKYLQEEQTQQQDVSEHHEELHGAVVAIPADIYSTRSDFSNVPHPLPLLLLTPFVAIISLLCDPCCMPDALSMVVVQFFALHKLTN